jgi:hypothetical protein
MIVVFANAEGDNRGRVVALESQRAGTGSVLSVDGWGGFQMMKSIITRVRMDERTNHQMMHTLGDRIYLHPFGDRIGALGISGISFYASCVGVSQQFLGISLVREYYKTYRLSRYAVPLKITLDPASVLEGYLAGFQAQTLDVAQRLFQFNLVFELLPPED